MNVQDIVSKILKDTAKVDYEDSKDEQIKNLGISSMKFLTMVIKVCKGLKIDFKKLKNDAVSTESTIEEFVAYFNTFMTEVEVN